MSNLQYKLALVSVYALIAFLMLWAVAANAQTVCWSNGLALSDKLRDDGYTATHQFVDDAGIAWVHWHQPSARPTGMVTSHDPKTGQACIETALPSTHFIFRDA